MAPRAKANIETCAVPGTPAVLSPRSGLEKIPYVERTAECYIIAPFQNGRSDELFPVNAPDTDSGRTDLLDRAAMGVSMACMAHCLALPLMLTFAPTLLPAVWDDVVIHLVALGLALPLALVAILMRFRETRDTLTLALAGCGLAGMAVGIALHEAPPLDFVFTFAGAGALGVAHFRNFGLRRRNS